MVSSIVISFFVHEDLRVDAKDEGGDLVCSGYVSLLLIS